jgi:hypothetical protein
MSDSWDEKHARNKGKAKDAFEQESQKKEPDLSASMKAALDGLRDRRRGPADRREQDLHASARKMDKRSVLDVLRGAEAKRDEPDKKEGPPQKERPAPPPPQLALGGTKAKMEPPPPEVQQRETEQARMRALLNREKERERDRDRSR